ncbi:MAG: IS200/IS605 family transposase [Spirosoma sp.]|nr:IS200/IS605 family transposase [Spirosoma sp.]
MKQLEKSRSATYNLGYHIIFCPKYRRRVLVGAVEVRLKEIVLEVAKENDWQIATLEVMPDHIHLFVKVTPMDSPANIVARIKGRSSFVLRNEFPDLKTRLPSLWTRSYYVESIGSISAEAITQYIDNQKKR